MKILRVQRTLQQTRTYYNRLSRWYDFLSGPFERQYTWKCLALMGLQAGERVLEVGFGTGHALVRLAASVGIQGTVVGVDLSPRMAEITRRRLHKFDLTERVGLVTGDARRLPFSTGGFDAILMSFTLELFDTPDLPTVLDVCRLLLHTGGRLGVVSLGKPERRHFGISVYEWFHRTFPAAVDCRPIPASHLVQQAGFTVEHHAAPVLLGILPLEIVVGRANQ